MQFHNQFPLEGKQHRNRTRYDRVKCRATFIWWMRDGNMPVELVINFSRLSPASSGSMTAGILILVSVSLASHTILKSPATY